MSELDEARAKLEWLRQQIQYGEPWEVVCAALDSAATREQAAKAQGAREAAYAKFGAWAFEMFWHDGEPGDIDAADAQEKAAEFGLLGRTSEADAGATHAEECEWQPGMPLDECCCYTPMLPPLASGGRHA